MCCGRHDEGNGTRKCSSNEVNSDHRNHHGLADAHRSRKIRQAPENQKARRRYQHLFGFKSDRLLERANLTMRMSMRRFTRLTNGFSKKVDSLEHSVSLHFMHYNFARIHKTLSVTPAVEAGIADNVWSLEEIAALAD